jgi:hypothetical protein
MPKANSYESATPAGPFTAGARIFTCTRTHQTTRHDVTTILPVPVRAISLEVLIQFRVPVPTTKTDIILIYVFCHPTSQSSLDRLDSSNSYICVYNYQNMMCVMGCDQFVDKPETGTGPRRRNKLRVRCPSPPWSWGPRRRRRPMADC